MKNSLWEYSRQTFQNVFAVVFIVFNKGKFTVENQIERKSINIHGSVEKFNFNFV